MVLGVLGLLVGGVLALISVRLPQEEGAVGGRLRYLLIGAGAGVIGAWAGWHGGGDWALAGATALLGWQLLLIALIDAEHHWLPDVLTWPLVVTGVAVAALDGAGPALMHAAGAVAGFVALWLLGWLYRRIRGREGLGGGDPFLFAGAGAWVGWTGLPSVLLWASAAGLSVVVARLALRRPLAMADRLPFGVFLAVGIWLVWLYGPLGVSAP